MKVGHCETVLTAACSPFKVEKYLLLTSRTQDGCLLYFCVRLVRSLCTSSSSGERHQQQKWRKVLFVHITHICTVCHYFFCLVLNISQMLISSSVVIFVCLLHWRLVKDWSKVKELVALQSLVWVVCSLLKSSTNIRTTTFGTQLVPFMYTWLNTKHTVGLN